MPSGSLPSHRYGIEGKLPNDRDELEMIYRNGSVAISLFYATIIKPHFRVTSDSVILNGRTFDFSDRFHNETLEPTMSLEASFNCRNFIV